MISISELICCCLLAYNVVDGIFFALAGPTLSIILILIGGGLVNILLVRIKLVGLLLRLLVLAVALHVIDNLLWGFVLMR